MKRLLKVLLIFILALVGLAAVFLVFLYLGMHPALFGGDSLYKPLSDCPLPAPAVPEDAHWSAVVPDSAWGLQSEDRLALFNSIALDSQGRLYLAGNFYQIGDLKTGGVARWDPAGASWHALGGGLLGPSDSIGNLHLLVDPQDRVFVWGNFTMAGDQIANGVAMWDGAAWHALGGGVMDGQVNALALDGQGGLYIAGSFTRVGKVKAMRIAYWDGQDWQEGAEMDQKLAALLGSDPQEVTTIAFDPRQKTLYASGSYNKKGSAWSFIAAWQQSGRAWNSLADGGTINVSAMAIGPKGEVVMAGSGQWAFSSQGIAVYDRGQWRGLRGGLTLMGGSKTELANHGATNVPNLYATSLAVDRDGKIYLSGRFDAVDDRCMHGVASWNGSDWSTLGSGVLTQDNFGPASARALALDAQGNLYVAGGFQTAGGKPIRFLARWMP